MKPKKAESWKKNNAPFWKSFIFPLFRKLFLAMLCYLHTKPCPVTELL